MVKGEKKPKLIVMPLQPAPGQAWNGLGLGLHFFLGNLFCVHRGLLECWFGWRVKTIFPGRGELPAYCRSNEFFGDIQALASKENIRFWIEGRYRQAGQNLYLEVFSHDSAGLLEKAGKEFVLSFEDGLAGFRIRFFDWLEALGFPFEGRKTALWQENISIPGLDGLGRALETLYISYLDESSNGACSIDMDWFDRAVKACPDSYLAWDLKGWGHYKNGENLRAEAAFLKALGLNPQGLGAHAGLMWCAIENNDREKAILHGQAKAACRGGDLEKVAAFVDKKLAQ